MIKKILLTIGISTLSLAVTAGQKGQPIEPVMQTIPAGSLQMTDANNKQHNIDIAEFSLGKYEVTVAEFRRFIEATNYQVPTECRHELDIWFLRSSDGNWEANALTDSEFQPVVCINWQAANAYTKWLAEETGRPYRLPTETEWEYAARAGTKTDYFFGEDNDDGEICKYDNTSDLFGENILQMNHNTSYHNWADGKVAKCTDYSAYASIVGMYQPNPNGLYDLISNVREFLADCSTSDITQLPKDGSPFLSESCDRRATRGSSWHWSHWPLASRASIPTEFAGGVDGFRLALDGAKPNQSQATKRFVAQLNFAQQQERKRRKLTHPAPDAVTNLTLKQTLQGIKLTWQSSNDESKKSYRIYKNDLPGRMFRLYASNIYDTQFIDANAQSHEYEYTVVAVKHHQQSHYAPAVIKPASSHAIPGIIQAEWFDKSEGAGISYTSDETTGARLGFNLSGSEGILKDAVIKYRVNITDAGDYQFNYRVAAAKNTQGFKILIDDKEIDISQVSDTGGYHEWQTQGGKSIHLPKGEHTLTLVSKDNNWKLNWFKLVKL